MKKYILIVTAIACMVISIIIGIIIEIAHGVEYEPPQETTTIRYEYTFSEEEVFNILKEYIIKNALGVTSGDGDVYYGFGVLMEGSLKVTFRDEVPIICY